MRELTLTITCDRCDTDLPETTPAVKLTDGSGDAFEADWCDRCRGIVMGHLRPASEPQAARVPCPHCDVTFGSKNSARAHVKKFHGDAS